MIKTEYTITDYLQYEREVHEEVCMLARKYIEKFPPLKLCVVLERFGLPNDNTMIDYEKDLKNAYSTATIYFQRNHNILDYRKGEGIYCGYTHELVRSKITFFTRKRTLNVSENHFESIKYYIHEQVEEYIEEMDLYYEDIEETKNFTKDVCQINWIE